MGTGVLRNVNKCQLYLRFPLSCAIFHVILTDVWRICCRKNGVVSAFVNRLWITWG